MTPTPEDIALLERLDLTCVNWRDMEFDEDRALEAIADYCAPLRELAEIGRLAVEARRLYDNNKGSAEWFAMECTLAKAADAYIAKEPKV